MSAPLDELVSLAMFARVVESKSFTSAAAKLGISKSAVSARLSQLERKMGVRLLHRSTRRVTLTSDGASLYGACAKLVRAAEEAGEAVARAGALLEGTVRITFPVGLSSYMPRLVENFILKHPAIQLELSSTDHHVNLIEEGFDIAIRITGAVSDPNLIVRRVGTEHGWVCASPKYLERHGWPENPEDLVQHRCLRSSLHSSEWRLDSERRSHRVRVSGNFISDNAALLLQAAVDGLGIAMLPASFLRADLEGGRLVRLLDHYSAQDFQVFVVHPYQGQVPAKVRVLIDYLIAQLQTFEQIGIEVAHKRARRRNTE